MRNAYTGKLFDNLRGDQRVAPFFELDDLYESNLKLYLLESFFQNIADALPKNQLYRFVQINFKSQKFSYFLIENDVFFYSILIRL